MPTRSTGLTVMSILCIVFGSLGFVCVGLNGLFIAWMANARPTDPINQILAETWRFMTTEIPGAIAVSIIQMILLLLFSVMLIVAGCGLLKLKNWARVLSIVVAVLLILDSLANLVYTLAYVNPAMNRFLAGLPGGRDGDASNAAMSVVGPFLFIGFGAALLIVMLNPGIAAQFRQAGGEEYYRRADEDDFGYDRRRPESY